MLLIVKTSRRDFRRPAPSGGGRVEPGTTAWSLAELLRGHPDPPEIRLITRRLSDGEIGRLHDDGDCFVSLCRSEGWGLGAFDAAAHGTPVVTTAFGGHLDYLAGSPHLVDFDLVAVEDPSGLPSYAPDQRWAEPDLDHGAAVLREVLADYDGAAAWAAARGRGDPTPLRARRDRRRVPLGGGRARGAAPGRSAVTTGVRWLSVAPGSGYGDASEAYLSGLRAAGVPVSWTPMGWFTGVWHAPFGPSADLDLSGLAHADLAHAAIEHDTVVVAAPPLWTDELAAEAAGRRLVAFTTWETDRIPEGWPAILSHYDRVLVPSEFNRRAFSASGLSVPVTVVPHIARPVPQAAAAGPAPGRRPFVCYTIATWSSRKAVLDTVAAFVGAFGAADDAVLVIHTSPEDHIAPGGATGTRHRGTPRAR